MEDVDRFFQQIVQSLAATDPGRLRSPLQLAEIRETILPYRGNRRALQLESSEDYELALIRLCAGQGGYARTEPQTVHAEFAAEVLSSNPDLSIVLRHPEAELILSQEHLARVLDPESGQRDFAPPDQRFAPSRETKATTSTQAPLKKSPRATKATSSAPANCRACGGKLPQGLVVRFCPHCGEDQTSAQCPECRTLVERSWRHCVTCGRAVSSQ